MKIEKYDIILTKPTTLKNKIIAKLLNQEYNHATIYIGNYHCLESNVTGVKIKEFNNRLGEFDAFRLRVRMTDNQKKDFEEFLQKQINKPYNLILAVGSLFNMKQKGNNSYVCYSLIVQGLRNVGININDDLKAFDKISKSNFFFKVN